MTPKEAKEFLREFLGDKPNFREERPGQDEEVYRQMDMLAEAIDVAISALELEQKILDNGYTGKEAEFRIGGRLFGIREKAQ